MGVFSFSFFEWLDKFTCVELLREKDYHYIKIIINNENNTLKDLMQRKLKNHEFG